MLPGHIEESQTSTPQTSKPQAATNKGGAERVVSTQELLAGARRLWIEHAAERYLLQVTRSGKLILTK